MNFTREPIIETVITPKEGNKLSVHSSKGFGQEEFLVEAVEVVSFGRAHFFRSLEKSKPFLLPVSDYEVVEVKEARMVLKGVGFEKTIKIGGGKEVNREVSEEKTILQPEETAPSQSTPPPSYQEKKRDRKRYRRKGGHQMRESYTPQASVPEAAPVQEAAPAEVSEEKKEGEAPPQVMRKLIPPPSTLIKEKLARIKGAIDEELFPSSEVTLAEGEMQKAEEKKESEEEFPSFDQNLND